MSKYSYVLNPLLSTALILLCFRVMSPLVFVVLGSPLAYAALLFVVILSVSLRPKAASIESSPLYFMKIGAIVLSFFLFFHGVLKPNALTTNFRYIGFLFLGVLLTSRFSYAHAYELARRMGSFFSYYLIFAVAVYASIATGAFDPSPWHVDYLNFFTDDNPLSIRRDFDYFAPWYSIILSANPNSSGFLSEVILEERFRGIFAEPTQLIHFTIPLLFLSLLNLQKGRLASWFGFLTLAISTYWAFSAAGFLCIFAICYMLVCARMTTKIQRAIFRLPLIALLLGVPPYLLFSDFSYIVGVFGANKLESFLYYSDRYAETIDALFESGLFGFGYEEVKDFVSNGLVLNVRRYGALGILSLIVFIAPMAFASWRLLSSRYFAIGMMGLSTLILLLKSPEIINLHLLVFYVLVIKSEQELRTRKENPTSNLQPIAPHGSSSHTSPARDKRRASL